MKRSITYLVTSTSFIAVCLIAGYGTYLLATSYINRQPPALVRPITSQTCTPAVIVPATTRGIRPPETPRSTGRIPSLRPLETAHRVGRIPTQKAVRK